MKYLVAFFGLFTKKNLYSVFLWALDNEQVRMMAIGAAVLGGLAFVLVLGMFLLKCLPIVLWIIGAAAVCWVIGALASV